MLELILQSDNINLTDKLKQGKHHERINGTGIFKCKSKEFRE
jgi:HD-GYP domain-containing protein (c-di-GMP phosphodiesterase class II)